MAKNTLISLVLLPIYNFISKFYVYIFARPSTQFVNNAILHLALRGRGYVNFGDSKATGEAIFIDLLAKTNPKLCIDIGANKGHYSETLLLKTGGYIVAFEPLPKAFESLSRLKAKYPNRFEAVNVGVGQKEGVLDLFYGEEDSEHASFSEEVKKVDYVGVQNKNIMMVPVTTLDTYFENNLVSEFDSIDLIKIDTEGFEYEVLMGAKNTISLFKPKLIQIEYNWHQLFRNHSLQKIAELLPDYSAYQMLPHGSGLIKRDLSRPESNIYHYSNFVFIRDGFYII